MRGCSARVTTIDPTGDTVQITKVRLGSHKKKHR
jgi:hypothetical protein